jgi:hypothetical protein
MRMRGEVVRSVTSCGEHPLAGRASDGQGTRTRPFGFGPFQN